MGVNMDVFMTVLQGGVKKGKREAEASARWLGAVSASLPLMA